MKFKQTAVLSSAAPGAAITTNEAGFLPGMQVLAIIAAPTGTPFVGSAIVQTSVDGSAWSTAVGAVAVTSAGTTMQVITLQQFLRLNPTAYTSGSIQGTFVSDIG
jgi:hypothetical protein